MSGTVTPFQEEASVENYFAGKPSEELWQQLRHVFTEESALIIVTGEAGVGKTMFCRKIAGESELPAAIFFFELVESFEVVITRIADAFFGINLDTELTGDAQINGLCDALQQRGLPVLLVFDQAENLYLATLERIRRLYDSLCEAKVTTSILFVGRPEFLDSYEQLGICNFAEATEHFFSLQELSVAETERYLEYAAGRCGEAGMALFSRPEFIQNLKQAASGNYRIINTVISEWLNQPQEPDTFIETLQDSGEQGRRQQDNLFTRLRGGLRWCLLMLRQLCRDLYRSWWQEQLPGRKKVILLSLGGLLVASGIALLLPSGNEPAVEEKEVVSFVDSASEPVSAERQKQQPSEMIPADTGENVSIDDSLAAAAGEQAEAAAREQSVPPPLLSAQKGQKKVLIQQEDDELLPAEGQEPFVIQAVSRKHEATKVNEEQEAVVEPLSLPVIAPTRKKVRFQGLMDKKEGAFVSEGESAAQPGEKIVQLYPLKSSKYRANERSLASGRVIGRATERQRLVQNRFVAGMGWRSPSKGPLYTIKVAQLAGTEAKMLDEIFTAQRFRPLVTDLYLFSKGLSPEYVVVFYGEFSNRADAEKALRKISRTFPEYRPSLTTIQEAMQSVRR